MQRGGRHRSPTESTGNRNQRSNNYTIAQTVKRLLARTISRAPNPKKPAQKEPGGGGARGGAGGGLFCFEPFPLQAETSELLQHSTKEMGTAWEPPLFGF